MSQIYKSSSGGASFIGSPTYFQAYLSSPLNFTAGNTTEVVIFDTTTVNVGSNYHVVNGAFTAPITGYYGFSTTLLFNNLNALTSNSQIILAYLATGQSLRVLNQGSGAYSGGSELIVSASWEMPMTAGDIIQIQPFADGSGTFQIFGSPASSTGFNSSSTFSGWRIA
jgi:C1q domain